MSAPRPRGSAERSGLCIAKAGLGRRAEESEFLAISASNGGGRAAASANNFDRESKRSGRKIVPRKSKQHIRFCSNDRWIEAASLAASTCGDLPRPELRQPRVQAVWAAKRKAPEGSGPDNPIAWSHLAILLRHLF